MLRKTTVRALLSTFLSTLMVLFIITGAGRADEEKAKESYNMGVKSMQDGDLMAAEMAFKAALVYDEDFADAYLNLGVIYYGQKEYDKALDMFENATEKDKGNVDALANLGRVQTVLKKYVEAESSFKAAIALEATNGDLYNELGKVYYRKKNYSGVIETLTKCHELGAGTHLTHYMLGKSSQKQNKITEAIAALKKSVELKANYRAHFALGQIYLGQEKFQSAASQFKAAETADPKKAYMASYNYAVAMESQSPDEIDANIANWERYVGLAKNIPKAKSEVVVAQEHIKALRERKAHDELQ